MSRAVAQILLIAVLSLCFGLSACSIATGTLGGREKCWDESEPRLASLMKGRLELDPAGSTLATPEGDRLFITFPRLTVRSDTSGTAVVVDGNGAAVARNGELVTVFGGLGDGSMVVCAIEERN
jgi:hypothetical protein